MATATAPLSQRERQALCDLFTQLGPDVPTLCQGWRSADLAAHLFVRDHRPDAAPGMVANLGPLTAWANRAQHSARDTISWTALVDKVRSGPPALVRPLDRGMNTIEYFVHHEDLRRAQPGWAPRALAPEDEAELWRRVGFFKVQHALLGLRPGHRPPASRLEAEGLAPLVLTSKPGPVVKGPAGEIVLWLLGRRQAARVEVSLGDG
jgi:uncharacterized protein (TIGR03085 family)